MNKDKLIKLQRYLDLLTNRKTSLIPEKHKDHPLEFIKFLDNEIRMVKLSIERAKE